ncbi:MAG: hypothetical protein N2439_11435 [Anaerolineae bacterium]|nr:hypothetical protein [Anaerolineae bacterium]
MGLIARVIEEQGIATVCVVMSREIAEAVRPPRALWVRFPYGAPLGPAGRSDLQREVIRQALDLLVRADAPGTIVEANIEWPE